MPVLPLLLVAIALPATVAPVEASEHDATVTLEVAAFEVAGDNPLPDAETRELLSTYLGTHRGVSRLRAAAAKLEAAIHAAGHPFHRVVLPPQTPENGRILMRVVRFSLARIDVSGNGHFSDDNVRRSLPALEPGTPPDLGELATQLLVANAHPAKQVTVRFAQSDTPDAVDAEIAVEDRRPWQLFAGLNNTGTDATGEFRLSAGVQHANLFDRDHALTLGYTTSPGHVGDVRQLGASYAVPVYAVSGTVSLFYSESDVDSGTVEQVFDVSGAGRFLGASYAQTLRGGAGYRHAVTVGIEDRRFENNVRFGGLQLGVDVRSRPLAVTYTGTRERERSSLGLKLSYVMNLPGGARNGDATYAAARAGAERDWHALRYAASAAYGFESGWLVTAALSGQHASEPLISGEQFGLGGADSVRGFEERAVSGDRGQRASIEAWTPPLAHGIRLLAFADAGHVTVRRPAAGQIASETLISAGIGLRWRWKDRLVVDVDYGHALRDARAAEAGGVKTHFSVFWRF